MSIADIKAGLAANLGTVSGLRVSTDVPDQINVPMAVLELNSVNYDQAFQQGMTQYNFTISLFVARASERNAQRKLDAYADTGASGIKDAVQSDRTLGGAAYDVRVVDMSNISAVSLGEVSYLAADFTVSVYAD